MNSYAKTLVDKYLFCATVVFEAEVSILFHLKKQKKTNYTLMLFFAKNSGVSVCKNGKSSRFLKKVEMSNGLN